MAIKGPKETAKTAVTIAPSRRRREGRKVEKRGSHPYIKTCLRAPRFC